MTPVNPISLTYLTFMILPGLYYNYLQLKHGDEAQESKFVELAKVIGFSSLYSSIGFMTVGILGAIFPGRLANFKSYFVDPGNYVDDHPIRLILTLAVALLIGLLSAYLVDAFKVEINLPKATNSNFYQVLFNNVSPSVYVEKRSPIRKLVKSFVKKRRLVKISFNDKMNMLPVARINLGDGNIVVGLAVLFGTSSNQANREILLIPFPFSMKKFLPLEFAKHVQQIPQWQKMHIPGHAIKSVEVAYVEFKKLENGDYFIPDH